MSSPVPFVRTPDSNFDQLHNFPFEPHYCDVDGLRMHYVDEGAEGGPVALMLHGMPTWSYLYRSVIPVLRDAGFRCVAPDHIGFGRSDKVTEPAWYDIARHTANLTRLIRTLDLHDITLFVQDWGGPTGLAQVPAMPDRFTRLVIMNTWLHHDRYEYTTTIRRWIAANQPGGVWRDNIPRRFGWGSSMAIFTNRATPEEAVLPAMRGEPLKLTGEAAAVCAAYDSPFAGLGEEGVTGPRQFPLLIPLHDPVRGNADTQVSTFNAINATALPVHFVWGLEDEVFTGEWGHEWQRRIPHATWDALDNAGHFLQDTHGEEIAEVLLRRFAT